MVWNYAEVNPFSSITGNFRYALKNVVAAVEKLPCGSQVATYLGDAVSVEFPNNVLVCAELDVISFPSLSKESRYQKDAPTVIGAS